MMGRLPRMSEDERERREMDVLAARDGVLIWLPSPILLPTFHSIPTNIPVQ